VYPVVISHAADQKDDFVDFLLEEFTYRYPNMAVHSNECSPGLEATALDGMRVVFQGSSVGESEAMPMCDT
jgi:hypothetical protein